MIRVFALLKVWAADRRWGSVTIRFKGGGIVSVSQCQETKPEELPLPELLTNEESNE